MMKLPALALLALAASFTPLFSQAAPQEDLSSADISHTSVDPMQAVYPQKPPEAPREILKTPEAPLQATLELPTFVVPGKTTVFTLRLDHEIGWHTYAPGEPGATTVEWRLPEGWEAAPLKWPVPIEFDFAGVKSRGFTGVVTLRVPVKVAWNAEVGKPYTVAAKINWVVCGQQQCIPQGRIFMDTVTPQVFALTNPVKEAAWRRLQTFGEGSDQELQTWETQFSALIKPPVDLSGILWAAFAGGLILNLMPCVFPVLGIKVLGFLKQREGEANRGSGSSNPDAQDSSDFTVSGNINISKGAPTDNSNTNSSTNTSAGNISNAGDPTGTLSDTASSGVSGGDYVDEDSIRPGTLFPKLKFGDETDHKNNQAEGNTRGDVGGISGEVGGEIKNVSPLVGASAANKTPVPLFSTLGLQQAFFYALGIVLSLCALGGLVLALRAGGDAVGWGFQLQDPRFVWAMLLVMGALTMNLAGGLELPSVGGNLTTKLGARKNILAFLNGLLMVLVATPCSAPFLGAALGSLLVLPAGQVMQVMAMMGVGLSLPYVLLTISPALLRWLPRPGAWMEKLKQILAWMMGASAVYLAWVFMGQLGAFAALQGLLAAVAVLFALWLAANGRRAGKIAGVVFLLLGVGLAWGAFLENSSASTSNSNLTSDSDFISDTSATTTVSPGLAVSGKNINGVEADRPKGRMGDSHGKIFWDSWSPEKVVALRAQGRPVVVDFTARWCVTCLVNERVWQTPAVRKLLAEKNVVLLKADWTNKDGRIAKELQKHGRAAVPLVVVYRPDGSVKDLANLLSVAQVVEALGR